MSDILNNLLALAEENAAIADNMTEATTGGAGRRLLPAGYAFGRLVEVVELGNHPQTFEGAAKAPAPEQQLAFALWGQQTLADGTVEFYHDPETGKPHIERLLPQAVGRNEKSGAFKLFKALNWKGTATSFGQLLTQPFLVKIHHVGKSKKEPNVIVSRIDLAGFLPPLDPVTKAPYAVPEADPSYLKLFLWNKPTKATWDSLFIEGQWDAKPAADGKPARAAESKNKVQEYILKALNFQGSPLETMLAGGGLALPTAPLVAPTVAAAAPAVPSAPVTVATVPSVTVPAAPAAAEVAVPLVAAPTVAPTVPAAAIATPVVVPVVVPSSPVLPV